MYACKVGHTFDQCSREKEANVPDHKGCNSNGTNEEHCLLMRSKHQPKQSLKGGTIFMRGCLSVLSCPPRHLSHHHSITVCLHYLQSWMNHGSGLSLGSCGCPALPHLPLSAFPNNPATAHTHAHKVTPTHIKWIHKIVFNSFPLLISGRYRGLLWLDHSTIKAPLVVLETEVLCMGYVSSCRSVKGWALKNMHSKLKGAYGVWKTLS